MERPFLGSHAALFVGEKLLVILRDDIPTIPSPNCWDFPGGTADAGETPFETLQREVREEVSLHLPESALIWQKYYRSVNQPDHFNWFYVARLPATVHPEIALGDEGQRWDLMTPDAFLSLENVVPSFPPRLRDWMAGVAAD
ncbi:NUDIX hydrolase [Yoonia sp. 208BN28-4]|uniref:NUDIX hydrolase n=1 Tax=Yoonia sp. 208BN28-4 TaxID=3126505 RepID=UPI0030A06B63